MGWSRLQHLLVLPVLVVRLKSGFTCLSAALVPLAVLKAGPEACVPYTVNSRHVLLQLGLLLTHSPNSSSGGGSSSSSSSSSGQSSTNSSDSSSMSSLQLLQVAARFLQQQALSHGVTSPGTVLLPGPKAVNLRAAGTNPLETTNSVIKRNCPQDTQTIWEIGQQLEKYQLLTDMKTDPDRIFSVPTGKDSTYSPRSGAVVPSRSAAKNCRSPAATSSSQPQTPC